MIFLPFIALSDTSAMTDAPTVLAEQCASCHNVKWDDNGVITSINGIDTLSICRAFAEKDHLITDEIMGRLIRGLWQASDKDCPLP